MKGSCRSRGTSRSLCNGVVWYSNVVQWCGAVVWRSGVVQWCGAVVWCSGVVR